MKRKKDFFLYKSFHIISSILFFIKSFRNISYRIQPGVAEGEVLFKFQSIEKQIFVCRVLVCPHDGQGDFLQKDFRHGLFYGFSRVDRCFCAGNKTEEQNAEYFSHENFLYHQFFFVKNLKYRRKYTFAYASSEDMFCTAKK